MLNLVFLPQASKFLNPFGKPNVKMIWHLRQEMSPQASKFCRSVTNVKTLIRSCHLGVDWMGRRKLFTWRTGLLEVFISPQNSNIGDVGCEPKARYKQAPRRSLTRRSVQILVPAMQPRYQQSVIRVTLPCDVFSPPPLHANCGLQSPCHTIEQYQRTIFNIINKHCESFTDL